MDRKHQDKAGGKAPGSGLIYKLQTSPMTQVAVLLAAAAFLTLGITRGEVLEVFKKAVKICLECIGLG